MNTESNAVCVFSESRDVGLQLLVPAREIASAMSGEVVFVSLQQQDLQSRDPIFHGADRVLAVQSPYLDGGSPETFGYALCEAIRNVRPAVALIGATGNGTEIAARAAQRLGVACATQCLEMAVEQGTLVVERRWLGAFIAGQIVRTRPALATVPPGRYEIPPRDHLRGGQVELLSVEVPEPRTRVTATRRRPCSGVRLQDAEIIVAVGRGLRNKEDLPLLYELAEVLGGAVGGTRPLTDDFAWLPVDLKVGLSGHTVRPSLYIACGISGQIEHVVGMRESRLVVAIDRDPNALILKEADYRIVGDLYEIVPALTRVLKDVRKAGAKTASENRATSGKEA
ncbi:MAG: electron transfer flavoprotein subunit alpha/FixB family protein [Acidobacteriota bacterium]